MPTDFLALGREPGFRLVLCVGVVNPEVLIDASIIPIVIVAMIFIVITDPHARQVHFVILLVKPTDGSAFTGTGVVNDL